MKIDGLEWMDWLHKMREEESEAREKAGMTIAEYLKKAEAESELVIEKHGLKKTVQTKVAK